MRAIAVTSKFRSRIYFQASLATLVFALAIFFAMPSHSADDTAAVRAEFNKTYSMLLHNPSDVELTLKYADLAVRLNDYEAAIPPLERLVMLDPTLYRTKVKLGTFYAKLGSNVVARSYFSDVANDANAPKDIVNQAKQHLNKL